VSDPVDLTKFREAVEARRQKQAEEAAKVTQSDADLIPDSGHERTEEDKQLDEVIDKIDIVDAYNRWCGKSIPKIATGQREGIKISCPVPDHPDRDPSAWINLDKNTWYCGRCSVGGDVYDIAAYSFGFPVPDYKKGATFHKLRQQMAESYGYTFIKPPGMTSPVLVPPPVDEPEETSAEVIPLVEEDEYEDIIFPTFDWHEIVQPQTFLDRYMQQTHIDDVPEEYHFWNALVALGLALGKEVNLYDRVPVYGNLFVCLLGNTGDGKSRSFSHMRRLLKEALPHKWDDPASKGAHVIGSPASAEVLIHNFSKPVLDPTNPKIISYYAPVRGLVEFNELSALTSRTSRLGNALKPALMEFYDMAPSVMTSSMTGGKKQADEPFASVFTTTQPLALKDLMRRSDVDSGFLNRWVFASGQQKQRVVIGGTVIDVKPAVKPLQDVHGWAGFGKQISWSKEAADKFTEYVTDTVFPIQKNDTTGFLTRIDLTLKKLVLLLTANVKQEQVPVEIVEQVVMLFPYLVAAYGIPAAQVGNTALIEIQDVLIRHIKNWTEKKGHGMTYRELYLRIKSKKYPPDLVHKMLKILTDMGLIEAVASNIGKVGRPTVRYKYVG
jgi:energy-coupling factor transporter ATP-binding protein EcfA2